MRPDTVIVERDSVPAKRENRMRPIRTLLISCAVFAVLASAASAQTATAPAAPAQPAAQAPAQPSTYEPVSGQAGKDVVWVPSHQALVDRMLDMAEVTPRDYLVDLGSGDGRTVISAAKRGLRALGIEYNPDLVALSQRNAEREGVADKVRLIQGDIFESDFRDATVVTLFLLPELNLRLRPTILAMKPGTRVVANSFGMGEWRPDLTIDAGGECVNFCRAHKWVVPAQVAGIWRLPDGELHLQQSFQMLAGNLKLGGKEVSITDAKMNGLDIAFTADGRRFTGRLEGDRFEGSSKPAQGEGAEQPWTAMRAKS